MTTPYDIVFSPGRDYPEDRVFVEVESPPGVGVRLGEWIEREDGYQVLRIPAYPREPITDEQVEAVARSLHDTPNPWFVAYGSWEAAGFEIKQAFRESARIALHHMTNTY